MLLPFATTAQGRTDTETGRVSNPWRVSEVQRLVTGK